MPAILALGIIVKIVLAQPVLSSGTFLYLGFPGAVSVICPLCFPRNQTHLSGENQITLLELGA